MRRISAGEFITLDGVVDSPDVLALIHEPQPA
jgi:hypothetical protein